MSVSTNYGLLAYQSFGRAQANQASTPTNATVGSADVSVGAAAIADQVTLSNAAQAVLANASGATSTRSAGQQHLLDQISNDPAGAEKIAYGMAHATSQIAYRIDSNSDVRLLSTDEIVTPDRMQSLREQDQNICKQMQALYDAENGKGTDPREIVAKLVDLKNSFTYSRAV